MRVKNICRIGALFLFLISTFAVAGLNFKEIILEDFENSYYSSRNLAFRQLPGRQLGSIALRSGMAAPTGSSRKYLAVKVFGKRGDSFTIIPAKRLFIRQKCISLGIWVYGKRFSGELSLYIRDSSRRNRRLRIGYLNYLGWKKYIIRIPAWVIQNGSAPIEITKFVYRPGNSRRQHPKWQYFYMDDIKAYVR